MLVKDRRKLNQELIRFHIVANSDSEQDQAVKLLVRDAVLSSIQEDIQKIKSKEEAEAYLRSVMPQIQKVTETVLYRAGFDYPAVVSYCREAFPVRLYDTFSLPSGIYDTLRITIGEGKGQNWWCVSFPSLCLGQTKEAFYTEAASSGMPMTLAHTLSNPDQYQIRFYLLDKLGELENYFFTLGDCQNP